MLYVNVHVPQKVCVAQILIYHQYLFIFYFKRKRFQNVLQWSEMYLMPKTSFFFLIVRVTDVMRKMGESIYTWSILIVLYSSGWVSEGVKA